MGRKKMEQKVITCEIEKCTGCQICDLVCSAKKEKAFNPSLSRIRTIRIEPDFNMASVCRLCEDPTCVKSCPKNALQKSEEKGIITVIKERCSGCDWCIQGCEFGAILLLPKEKVVAICDLCDGDPECVKACPKEALKFATRNQISQRNRLKAISLRKLALEAVF